MNLVSYQDIVEFDPLNDANDFYPHAPENQAHQIKNKFDEKDKENEEKVETIYSKKSHRAFKVIHENLDRSKILKLRPAYSLGPDNFILLDFGDCNEKTEKKFTDDLQIEKENGIKSDDDEELCRFEIRKIKKMGRFNVEKVFRRKSLDDRQIE